MKKNNLITIFLSLFLILAIGVTVFYGKYKSKQEEAKIVNSIAEEEKTKKQEKKETEKKEEAKETPKEEIKKDRFEGMTLKDNTKGVPVLYYHSVEDGKKDDIIISKDKFRKQMQYLKDNGYTTLTLEELYAYINENKAVPEKSVVITFDDGYADNYTNAYPILKEFGFNATIFVITSTIDNDNNYLNSKQIKEMAQYGIDIQSHTEKHDNYGLVSLSKQKQIEELKNSKETLEKITDKKVEYIAYPSGKYNDQIINLTKEAGYKMAFTINSGWADKNNKNYEVKRVYIMSSITDEIFKERITKSDYKVY